jgi:glycosyltransferase involved in cell wall biosynthesis
VNVKSNARFIYSRHLSLEKCPALFAVASRSAAVLAIFAGAGPCSKRIAAASLEAQLLGFLDAGQVAAALRWSRTLLFSAGLVRYVWTERHGGRAVGVPGTVPDTSACKKLVIDYVTRLWFKGGNVESLSDKLRELAIPRVDDRFLREAHRRFWFDQSTTARHVDALLEVYEGVLGDAA